jgi:hypothetical protein
MRLKKFFVPSTQLHLASISAIARKIDHGKGTCFDKNALKCHSQTPDVSCQHKEFVLMTLQDALTAYRTYVRAEGKSAKTVTSWRRRAN